MPTGRIEQPILESQALQGNRFNDPTTRLVTVYLPPDYDVARRYPTLYLLAAHGRTGASFLNWRPWEENMLDRLNRLMGSGEVGSAIVVMPDTWTRLGSSQYLNSAIGSYEDYLIKEIVPFIDDRYATNGKRGVLGHSSGGYGAIVQAMKHPDIFAAVACHAGDMYWEYICLPGIAELHQGLAKYGGAEVFLNTIDDIRPKGGTFWKTVMTMCWTLAHSPGPDYDLPIDPNTGALDEAVWARWLDYDPLRMLRNPDYQAALHGMKLVQITAGLYDEYQLQIGARLFCQKLAELGIVHLHEEYEGSHSSADVPYDRSFRLLVEALSR